jgi:hypothetical protein
MMLEWARGLFLAHSSPPPLSRQPQRDPDDASAPIYGTPAPATQLLRCALVSARASSFRDASRRPSSHGGCRRDGCGDAAANHLDGGVVFDREGAWFGVGSRIQRQSTPR